MGGSFFATFSHTMGKARSEKPYDVVFLADFRGVIFRLAEYDVCDEPAGVQLAFLISDYDSNAEEDYFAEVNLEIGERVLETPRVPRELHRPNQLKERQIHGDQDGHDKDTEDSDNQGLNQKWQVCDSEIEDLPIEVRAGLITFGSKMAGH